MRIEQYKQAKKTLKKIQEVQSYINLLVSMQNVDIETLEFDTEAEKQAYLYAVKINEVTLKRLRLEKEQLEEFFSMI